MAKNENELSLADAIARAVNEARQLKSQKEREGAAGVERENVEKAQIAMRSEEIKRLLNLMVEQLGINDLVRNLVSSVWEGGKVTVDLKGLTNGNTIGPNGGQIVISLEFSYFTAHHGYSSHDSDGWFSSDTYMKPEIVSETDNVNIRIVLNKGGSPEMYVVLSGKCNGISTHDYLYNSLDGEQVPVSNLEQAKGQIYDFVIKDSTKRIMAGKLPVAEAILNGRKKIEEVQRRAKEKREDVVDRTNGKWKR